MSLYIALTTTLHIVHNAIAHTIDCTTQQCDHTNIDCLPNEDCFVSCDDPKSCLGALITCPVNGDCDILCRGGESCRDSVINATLSKGNFNLLCQESTDHCRSIKILGSTQPSTDNAQHTFNVTCNGNQSACIHSQITCPLHQNCSIHCDSDTSCRWMQINGPKSAELTVHCNGISSCFDATFDASQSSKLEIKGCVNDESCLDLTFHCPPNTNGHKNCFIQGNDNIGRDNQGGTKIYAINGWNDIEIDYFGHFGTAHSGTMFCGEGYGIACDIASDEWTCVNDNDYCNFYNDTSTVNPIIHTTNDPTFMPSETPSAEPSHEPTLNPSVAPTSNPSDSPTVDPTVIPTSTPTGIPSSEPSDSPTNIVVSYSTTHKPINIEETELYTTATKLKYDSEDEVYIGILAKDRGVHWYLEVRIVFGIAVFVMIIIVAFCCYFMHKRKKKSFYHYRHTSIPKTPNQNRYLDTLPPYNTNTNDEQTEIEINEMKDNFALSDHTKNTFDLGTMLDTDPRSPQYNQYMQSIKSPKYSPKTQRQTIKDLTLSEDALELTPIQAEIVAVRQLLNFRKLLIQNPDTYNSDTYDSDIGSADTYDIIQRNGLNPQSTHSLTEANKSSSQIHAQIPLMSETGSKNANVNICENDFKIDNKSETESRSNSWQIIRSINHRYSHIRKSTPGLVITVNEKKGNVSFKNKRKKSDVTQCETITESPRTTNGTAISNSLSLTGPMQSRRGNRTRKATASLKLSENEFVMESESEMESHSDSNVENTTDTKESNEQTSQNDESVSDTYNDPIPTAC